MIRCYYLPVYTIDSTDQVAGTHIIHYALLECTDDPQIRKLTMSTTDQEHDLLVPLAISYDPATQEETDHFNAHVITTTPDPDRLRAEDLLATSPQAITQPEMWELMRIFGKLLGVPS